MERKTQALVISTALVLAVLSGIAVLAYANAGASDVGTTENIANDFLGYSFGAQAPIGRQGHRCGGGQFMTVSQEFKDKVLNIALNDSDVQNLLTEGHNVTEVRPIITTTVERDGILVTKATSAVVVLTKDTTSQAFASVDLDQAKVTEIVILTRTVIDKSST